MRYISNHKKRRFKRAISFMLVFILVLNLYPLDMVSEKIEKKTGLVMEVQAATDPEELAALVAWYDSEAGYSGSTQPSFTSGVTKTGNTSGYSDFSLYSKCFEDSTFAAAHASDIVTLAPVQGTFVFDSDYNPIGTSANPFSGTIKFTTSANEFAVTTYSPIFDYVLDSVGLMRLEDSVNIPVTINRAGDVGSDISPLFAKHVKGSGSESAYNWMIKIDAASVNSYSGVIYEMYDGAKINLTFTDNSAHTQVKDPNGNIVSGSIIANNESNTNYGMLCGRLVGSSELTATYTNTADTEVTFIGTADAYCGGLIGEINASTFVLSSGSSNLKVKFESAKNEAGFICGHAEAASITLPTDYTFQGTVDGINYAGGIAGYCKNTTVNYTTTSGTITLASCNVKNGTSTGGVFGYYECDTYANDIVINRTYNLSSCTIEGTGLSGGIAGEYKPTYTDTVTIDLNKYTIGNTTKLNTGNSAGGLFGKYTAAGSVTITDSDTSTAFAPPQSTVPYGGVIGEYVNTAYTNTLTLSGFTVNNLNATSSGNVGGVIGTLNGSTYVSVSGVSVTNVTANNASYFGGIISTLDGSNAGSYLDVTGNFTLSMASGKTYKGGALAGSFKTGVIRLAGTTDISGAQATNGYAQLVYENDETLVYAKGNGADSNWTLKRNAATTASDLGQWGEVVRMFDVSGTSKNAEDAGIVTANDIAHTVTVAQGVTAITDTVSFAKCALNMQLNDGSNHGPLCFADTATYPKSELLKADLTVSGTVNLSGTGLLGFMRDGGKGKYLNGGNNTFSNNVEFFTGSITGSNNAEIKLASGETYGTYAEGSTGTGGKIYLADNYGHDAQGLFAFAKGVNVTNLKVSGDIIVERKAGSNYLYAGALFGAMTNGAKLSGTTITTKIDTTRANNARFYIGGVAGVFDGNDTASTYTLTIDTSSSIKPNIILNGVISCVDSYNDNDLSKCNNTYAGGVLGLLKGSDGTKYNVSMGNSELSPIIDIGDDVADTTYSYLGGMIGRVRKNSANERSISLNTVTMTSASIDTKAKYPGGLLGAMWERTNLTVDGLTITGSTVNHLYSGSGSKQSGLVFMGSGKWDIKALSIGTSTFSSTDTAPESFGLIVNEAYAGDDGLYINLLNRGYTLTSVTVPTSSYYVDEIAADTKNNDKNDGDIMIGGAGTGIVNINMNAANGTLTKIVDSETPANGTGTYQNRLYSQLGNLVGNQNSRYYYNLDVMLAKGTKGSTATGGEQFLLWSVYNYAATNIRENFKDDGNMITATAIDLSGLSYYPIAGGAVTLPAGATITFGYNAIHDYENTASTPDDWKRFPDDTGDPNTATARNQHYLMQTGLFTTVSSLSANTLTLTGDFGYVEGVASGALINKSTSGSVSLTGLTLNKLIPSDDDSYLLINHIDGTGDATPSLTVSNLRATNYNATGVTLPVAKSLFGSATGQNMTMNFSDIKLDARDGNKISDTSWTTAAGTAMTNTYGTSRSIFSDAIFFTTLLATGSCNMEYNYAVEADWGDGTGDAPRNVTYGKEVTSSKQYAGGEMRYYLVGEADGNYTNPVSNSNNEFSFATGFLPYVGNYTAKGNNTTYPVTEIKVNYKVPGVTVGCGTYNDPYIISSASQLEAIANAIYGASYPSTIRLPNYSYDNHVSISWHDSTVNSKGCGIYIHSGTNFNKATNNTQGVSNGTWTELKVRYYLASAYYLINNDIELSSDFPGLGVPNDTNNNYKGSTVFHGVIVGDSTSTPTITNPTNNPLIVVANGAVVKNIDIVNTGNITREQTETGNNALYGYNGTSTDAKYYGGVIGEIMGGDNIIDDVTVTYTGTTTLSGNYAHIIAEGGMVGCVVNGVLIFRGYNTVTGRSVSGGGIYSNPYVGRVINGYAVYESIEERTGSAPANGNNYPIDTIVRNNTKLDVNYDDSTIDVPDAQSLYIMSLITQSNASTANTTGNETYGDKSSPSYGYNGYLYGVARLGDYADVGCGTDASQPTDYSSYAYRDSVNNYYSSKQDLVNAPVPYIIYRYTKEYGSDNVTSKNYPARKMTSDNGKFWDITLSESDTFASMDDFAAFRGIGSVGINAYSVKNGTAPKTAFKVATFDGGGNTINLNICLPRYDRDNDNYFHNQNMSLTQVCSNDLLTSPYGHDTNLHKLMGIGLFDCVIVKNDSSHEYQFQNFTLKGTIKDKVYDKNSNDITGTTDVTQLFCVGGVVGKRVYGGDENYSTDTDNNYKDITFDGLTISGAYSCGGLVGIDACKSKKVMKIDGCNSTTNGISVTGGYFGGDNNIRHGIGSFVGMTFWCRPYIDGKTDTSDTSDITVSKVTTYYEGDKGCSVGGLIGYTGSGAEIKNVNLVAANSNAVIGGVKASNVGGFIGFTQAMTSETNTRITPNENDLKDCIYIENCTIQNLPIKAKNGAAGFVSKTGNSDSWHTKYIYISDCAIIGDSESKPEIKAYGTGTTTQTNYAGGFVGDLRSSVVTCLIQNSYIENYTIEGWHVGGIIGETTYRSANLINLYVKDCEIVRSNSGSGSMGGIVGYTNQDLNGYNLKIDNVIFKKKSGSSYEESPSDAGFILGESNGAKINKFIAIGAYHTDASKVPTSVIKTNGGNEDNFFVFADYNNTSTADITAKTGYASSFNAASNSDMPLAPYVNTSPHMGMGANEYLSGDGASVGKAGIIYKDYKEETSNRRYSVGNTNITDSSVGNAKDAVTLAKYINADGSYIDGAFKISTASAEFGSDFTNLTGVDNFAMLVINNDTAKSADITPFIKSYIRLVTNAEGSGNQYKNNQYAYSTGNDNINKLYQVVVNPCYYDSSAGKFVLGTAGDQGLNIKSDGTYEFVSAKADSASDNAYQFSLIDVQFKDPTDSTKIAYHLYVPVYTKKLLSANFSAVTMSSTSYYRKDYSDKIASEIAANKNAGLNPSILVESTDEWTTTFIRFTYPKNQISETYTWNFDKSVVLNLDGNFSTLPTGTKMILLDPNANVDKFYIYTVESAIDLNTDYTLNLSFFEDSGGTKFTPQKLSDIYTDPSASSGNELYEDYYISIYVPNDSKTHAITFKNVSEMTRTGGSDKANIEADLYSFVVLGDLFNHEITSFTVTPENEEITNENNTITSNVTATIQLKDANAAPYLASVDIQQAFYITLTSHDADGRVSDMIYGTNQSYISNNTTISYNDGTDHTTTVTDCKLGPNYVQLKTGSIKNALTSSNRPIVTISSTSTITFMDINALPYNTERTGGIGTQVSVKSNIAYDADELLYTSMKKTKDDPGGKYYYVTTRNNAELNFSANAADDEADEIGLKTNNRSLLGVNGKYSTLPPIRGTAIYDVNDIVDYESANAITYTISLYKKETDAQGKTTYVQVDDISKYLTNVTLTDSEVTLTADTTDSKAYKYSGPIDHGNTKDSDKMFEADFSCKVITGDSGKREYANYRINLEAELTGATNTWKESYIIYTNAKFDPSVIDE